MKTMNAAGLMLLGCLAIGRAQNTETPATLLADRPDTWRKSAALAVSDESKAATAIQQVAEADRPAFARDVLTLLQSKPVADKSVLPKTYAATASALVSGAGSAKKPVLASVAATTVDTGLAADTREVTISANVAGLIRSVTAQLPADDRAAFAALTLQAIDARKSADATAHKVSICSASVALIAGGGTKKAAIVGELFAVTSTNDLSAMSAMLVDAFGQRKNSLSNEDYLQVATTILQAVSDRLSGMPDAAMRFSYAAAIFLSGSASPVTFEPMLMSKMSADMLAKVGQTQDTLARDIATAQPIIAAQTPTVGQALSVSQAPAGAAPSTTPAPAGSVAILTAGGMLAGEEGPPFVNENRPPAYQNQGVF